MRDVTDSQKSFHKMLSEERDKQERAPLEELLGDSEDDDPYNISYIRSSSS